MEKIELVVTHQAGAPADRAWSAIFGMAGGTIGRSGQNKLVLPDTDAEVARVHAMVRVDSDQAYLANLCERRSVHVNGLEVFSGQEVPLQQGAEVVIGSYRILAKVQDASQRSLADRGEIFEASSTSSACLQSQETATAHVPEQVASSTLDLASLPNPWADIPPIVGEQPLARELVELHTNVAPASDVATATDSNPFSFLGRVDAPRATAETTAIAESTTPVFDGGTESIACGDPEARSAIAASTLAPFARAAASQTHVHKPQHRPMVIPDDFDPFAADPKEAADQRDVWSGDLAAKSLTEVAQLKNDELLQSLPQTTQFAGDMDSAAHTGLPKQLDPHIELNPLKLFREPGESMYAEAEEHGLSRGSDLNQIFSLPRGVPHDSGDLPLTSQAATATSEAASLAPASMPGAIQAAEAAQAAGLQTMQGLDLDLFGTQAPASAAQDPGLQLFQPCVKEQSPASASRTSEASLQANSPVITVSTSSVPIQTEACPSMVPSPISTSAGNSALQGQAPTPTHANHELAAAFLEGAGVAPNRAALTITPDFMRDFGEALRIAVQGSIDLLSARSEIKREFRADVTIIASGKNNPLKFLPTAEGVMLQLVGQNFPGFMQPVPALQEAFNDLAVHQIALMAGIRAAYTEAVNSLNPAELEQKAANSASMLSKLSSLHRKAALWDEYQQRYESIRQHAEDDLMAFSGTTFVQAYENAARAAGEAL